MFFAFIIDDEKDESDDEAHQGQRQVNKKKDRRNGLRTPRE